VCRCVSRRTCWTPSSGTTTRYELRARETCQAVFSASVIPYQIRLALTIYDIYLTRGRCDHQERATAAESQEHRYFDPVREACRAVQVRITRRAHKYLPVRRAGVNTAHLPRRPAMNPRWKTYSDYDNTSKYTHSAPPLLSATIRHKTLCRTLYATDLGRSVKGGGRM
jgi:hypothetical protein